MIYGYKSIDESATKWPESIPIYIERTQICWKYLGKLLLRVHWFLMGNCLAYVN